MTETYKASKERLIAELSTLGWRIEGVQIKRTTCWAPSPSKHRILLYPRATYVFTPGILKVDGRLRTIDRRGVSGQSLAKYLENNDEKEPEQGDEDQPSSQRRYEDAES